jgi:hypothetical protein
VSAGQLLTGSVKSAMREVKAALTLDPLPPPTGLPPLLTPAQRHGLMVRAHLEHLRLNPKKAMKMLSVCAAGGGERGNPPQVRANL